MAKANTLAACDDTNPYSPPQLVRNMRTSTKVWQGRGRHTQYLMNTEMRSANRKHSMMPNNTSHHLRGSCRKVVKMNEAQVRAKNQQLCHSLDK